MSCCSCFRWLADPETVRLLRGSLIVSKRLLGPWLIEMSSHMSFVWMVRHFYHSHMVPVWPECSRTACESGKGKKERKIGKKKERKKERSSSRSVIWLRRSRPYGWSCGHQDFWTRTPSSLRLTLLLLFPFASASDQPTARTAAPPSALHANSANGLSLSRLPGENGIHMETVIMIENVCSVNRALMRCHFLLGKKEKETKKKWVGKMAHLKCSVCSCADEAGFKVTFGWFII